MADEKPVKKAEAKTEAKPKAKKWGFVKKLVIGIVAFVVIVFALAFFFTRGVAKAGDDVIANLQAGNCTEIYDVTSAGFQTNTSAEQWDAACQQIGPILQGDPDQRSVSVEGSTGDTSTGEVVYHIQGEDGIKYEVSLFFVDEDGWKLEGLDSRNADLAEVDSGAETTDETTEDTADTE